jgi:hypothetical protein
MAERTKLKAGCGLVMVFLAGALCGAVVLFLVIVKVIPLSEGWRDEESKEFVVNHLANRLSLTEEQIAEATPIIHEALEERYNHRKVYVEADIELTRSALEKMKPILDEKQQEKAKQMFENWKNGKKRFLMGAKQLSSGPAIPPAKPRE